MDRDESQPPDPMVADNDASCADSVIWLEENRDAIDAYNQRVQHDGVFSDGLRAF